MRLLPFVLVACSGSHATAPPPERAAASGDPVIVRVDSGALRGERAADAVAWKGIPYAAPPIGALRWRPPERPAAWTGVRDASGYGYPCMQVGTAHEPDGNPLGNEDCLTLNVWRPARDATPRAVMVFIHGGYFVWGSTSYRNGGVELYDGAQLATKADVVVVTMNYRLGPFGFLAHPVLSDEDAHHASGNFGLLDQIAALQWVQRNIAAFGGDPSRVTLFGQSAGAISSAALFASPLARGLFHRVILHSGNGDALPRERAEKAATELIARVRCGRPTTAATAACLREKSAMAIATAVPRSFAANGITYGPVVDGWVLPRKPIELVERGEHTHVPLIVATTSNEFSTMVSNYVDGPLSTADDYAAMVRRRFPAMADRLLARYPASDFATPLAAYTALWSDSAFACQSDWLADAAAAHQSEPVYRFVFAHGYGGRLERFGAGHGMDLYMIFRNTPPYLAFDDAERALSDQLLAVWARIAKTGDAGWPVHTATGHEQTVLDSEIHAAAAASARCDFWWPVLRKRPQRS